MCTGFNRATLQDILAHPLSEDALRVPVLVLAMVDLELAEDDEVELESDATERVDPLPLTEDMRWRSLVRANIPSIATVGRT